MWQVADGRDVVTIVQIGMGISLAFFFFSRIFSRKVKLHIPLALFWVGFNLVSSVFLVKMVHWNGFVIDSDFPVWVVNTHRVFATCIALMMIGMLYTGARRKRRVHVKMHFWFLTAYTIVFISGWILFIR